MAKQTESLARIEESYPVLFKPDESMALLKANLGNEKLSAGDLSRIKVPTGGGKFWAVPSLSSPDGAAVPVIEGIIIFSKIVRAYWAKAYGADAGANNPPDCVSENSQVGVGSPGGDCDTCPFSQYGTARGPNGEEKRSQACKQVRPLFMLLPDSVLPVIVNVPPSSLKVVRSFMLGAMNAGRHYSEIITRLALVQEKNKDGILYSRIQPSAVRPLEPGEIARVREYARSMNPLLDNTYLAADVVAETTEPTEA